MLSGTRRRRHRISGKAGLPPGTVKYIGDEVSGASSFQIFNYSENEADEKVPGSIEECLPMIDFQKTNWLNIDGVHNTEMLQRAGEIFHIHHLALEDIVNMEQRPKMEEYDGTLFIVLKMLSYNESTKQIMDEQVSMILMPHLLITFQLTPGDVFSPIRDRIRNNRGRIRKGGADYLAYALIDIIVDNYFYILERLGEEIEDLEERVAADPERAVLDEIQERKKQLIFLRRCVWPMRELASALEKREVGLIRKATKVYLRDVYDHTVELMDTLESLRDIASSLVDIYLSSISNRQNVVMKTLTLIATIFMPLTFIVGVYGMNFHNMPELATSWGYPAVWGIMAVITVGMLIYFKRNGWFK